MITRIAQQQRAQLLWTRHQPTLLALSVTLLGALLRLAHVNAEGLRLDETWSVWLAARSPADIIRGILFEGSDATPPTYYLLLHMFLGDGHDLLLVRAVSILAGTLMIWLTFQLAAALFDLRVALLSAALLAIAPLHVEYSLVARAYALSGLTGLFSLYMCARLMYEPHGWRSWLLFTAATLIAIYSHYITFLIVAVEYLLLGWRWLRRRSSRRQRLVWLLSATLLGLALLPLQFSVLSHADAAEGGQRWLMRPDAQTLVKSVILFSTGDPSYGPGGFTVARLLSLAVVVAICGLALDRLLRRRSPLPRAELERIGLIVGAAVGPWALALLISEVRPIYHEKYVLFVQPPWLIGLAWALTRARSAVLGGVLALVLIGLTGAGLAVYYSAPVGEQWREATAYLRAADADEPVIVSPGFYTRPFAFYAHGNFPANLDQLRTAPAVVAQHERIDPLDTRTLGSAPPESLATAERIWVVTGYRPIDPSTAAWLAQQFRPIQTGEFTGVRVQLMQRIGE